MLAALCAFPRCSAFSHRTTQLQPEGQPHVLVPGAAWGSTDEATAASSNQWEVLHLRFWPARVLARDGLSSYPTALPELPNEDHVHHYFRQRTRRYCNNRIESDHRGTVL